MKAKRLGKILLSIAVLFLIVSVATPFVVKSQIKTWLLNNGAEQADIERLYLNIWSGHVTLEKLTAKSTDSSELTVGLLDVDLSYRELWNKRVVINELKLANSSVFIKQADQQLQLGPINIPISSDVPAPAESPESPWRWGFNNLNLDNLNIRGNYENQDHRLQIETGALNLLSNWQPDQQSFLELKGNLNNSSFDLSSKGTPLAPEAAGFVEIVINKLDLAPLLRPWAPEVKGILTTDLRLHFSNQESGVQSNQDGKILLEQLHIEQPELDTTINSLQWVGKVQARLGPAGISTLESEGNLDINKINLIQGPPAEHKLNLGSDSIHWQGNTQITFADSQPKKVVSTGDLKINSLAVQHPQATIADKQLSWSGQITTDITKNLSVKGLFASEPSTIELAKHVLKHGKSFWQGKAKLDIEKRQLTQLSGNFETSELSLLDKQQSPLIKIKKLLVEELLATPNNGLSTAKLQISNIQLIHKNELLNLDRLIIHELEANQQAASLNTLTLGKLKTEVSLDKQGKPANWLAWSNQLSGDTSTVQSPPPSNTTEKTSTSDEAQPFHLSAKKVLLAEPAQIKFNDASVNARDIDIAINQFTVANIDTRTNQASPFTLKAKINRFGDFNVDGNYSLMDPNPNGDWEGKLANLELPPFSPYMHRFSGYQLRSGQFSLDTNGTIAEGQVDSTNLINFHNLNVKQANASKSDEFIQDLGMPLETAISILTDDDNNVELKIPVKGAVDDPKFGYQSVINIIMAKAAKEGAIGFLSNALQPYGALISLGRIVAEQARKNAIDLEPISFAAGSSTLNPKATDYLTKINQLLVKKEALRLNLCGIASSADKLTIQDAYLQSQLDFAPEAMPSSPRTTPTVLPMDEERLMAELNQLAEERSENVKGQLLQDGKIQPERLFSCLPVVQLEGEIPPSVTMGL